MAAQRRKQLLRLWQCPACKRRFANRNQSHACAIHHLASHLARSTPAVKALFDQFVCEARKCGPVIVRPEKTRIALQVRMSFAALVLQKKALAGHLVLAKRHELPCFDRVETVSPRNHVHHFRLTSAADFTKEFLRELRQAYAVGEQRHLRKTL